ncbi:MAG: alpha/beta hydrolase [Promethearchaeota archaeon]
MPFLDKSKMREDVLKLIERNTNLQMKAVAAFLGLEENKGYNLMKLMRKVGKANEEYYKIISNSDRSIAELENVLTNDEKLFLAKLFRYGESSLVDEYLEENPLPDDIKIESVDLDGIPAEWQAVPNVSEDRVLLYFHGGGQVLGSAKMHRLFTLEIGKAAKIKILSVNYRLAPEHPFPAGFEDCFNSYKWLLKNGYVPKNIVIGGDSSGGNHALAILLKIRDEGMELPIGGFALSPAIDYTLESKTKYTNKETDMLSDYGVFWWDLTYVAGQDPYNPYISPVHADMKGLPPLLLQVSTCEMLYDHSTRFYERAKAAGVDITLQEWDDMLHVWQALGLYELSESKEAIDKIGEFVQNLFK